MIEVLDAEGIPSSFSHTERPLVDYPWLRQYTLYSRDGSQKKGSNLDEDG